MAADQRSYRFAERAVRELLFRISILGIEPLRISDRELEICPARERNELIRLPQIDRDRLLEKDVLAGNERGTCHRTMDRLRRCTDVDGLHVLLFEDLAIIAGQRRTAA